MKKITKKQIEKLKTGVIIVFGIVIVIGLIFIVSNNTGDNKYQGDSSSSSSSSTNQSSSEGENPLLEEGEVINDSDMGELTDISYSDLETMISKKERQIVFLGSEYCGWCVYQKPILRKIVKDYNVQINYLNLGNVSEEDANKLYGLHDDLASFGTPCFIVLENGKVTVVDQGARGTNAMVEFLKTNGFISQ